jgi:hypothetical protein
MYSSILVALALTAAAFATRRQFGFTSVSDYSRFLVAAPLEPRDGFGVTTFSAAGCQGSNQGSTNVGGGGATACVEMGFANSFQVGSGCNSVQVQYHHNAGCDADEPNETDTVQEGCVNIPGDLGTHFSAQFSCLD